MPMSSKKRALFIVAMLAFVYVGVEGLAFVAFRVMRGEWFSFAVVRARQEEVASTSLGGGDQETTSVNQGVVPHPYLGYVFDPTTAIGASSLHPHGFQGEDGPVIRREPDTVNVAVFGGSVAQMFYEDGREELVARLRAHPEFATKRVRVVGFGTGGYKQPQQLIALAYMLGLGAEFDIVINIDGFNEIALGERSNVERGVHPTFPFNWRQLVSSRSDPETLRRVGVVMARRMARRDAARGVADSVLRYSVLANLIWEFSDERRQREVFDAESELAAVGGGGDPFFVTGPPVELADREAIYDAMVDVWFDCSLQMDRLCRANGARYFQFLQPNQYVEGSKRLTEVERSTAFDASSPYRQPVELGYPRLRARAAELVQAGLAFRDLTEVFAEVEETVYIDSCCHFNAVGSRIVATAIADEVRPVVPSASDDSPIRGIEAEPKRMELHAPLATGRVSVTGVRDGKPSRLTYSTETSFVSRDPGVATVSDSGVVEAQRPGEVEIEVRYRDFVTQVPVTVEFPPVVSYGRGVLRADAPRMEATLGEESVRFEMTNLQERAAVTLLVAFAPSRIRLCDAMLFVPAADSLHVPVERDGTNGRFEMPLPESMRGSTTYWQAITTDTRGACNLWSTDAIALSLR